MGEKVPPDKQSTSSGFKGFTAPKLVNRISPRPGIPIENQCVKCPNDITNQNEVFKCGFCYRITHVSCIQGSHTPASIKTIRDGINNSNLKYLCHNCETIYPSKAPINAILDEAFLTLEQTKNCREKTRGDRTSIETNERETQKGTGY